MFSLIFVKIMPNSHLIRHRSPGKSHRLFEVTFADFRDVVLIVDVHRATLDKKS